MDILDDLGGLGVKGDSGRVLTHVFEVLDLVEDDQLLRALNQHHAALTLL